MTVTIIELNDQPAAKMETVYVSCKDSAKLIREALKKAFPTVKFSVRISHYGAVDIHWTDGATQRQVEAVTNYYKGSTFDGSIDLASNTFRIEDGKRVNYGSDYISCVRYHSPLALQMALFTLCDRYGIVLPQRVYVRESKWGNSLMGLDSVRVANADNEYLYTLIHRFFVDWVAEDFTPKPEPVLW